MSRRGHLLTAITLALAAIFVPGPAWGDRQAGAGAMQALQNMAEKQGHPGAAVWALKNLSYRVPPEIEAEAAGITRQALRQAVEQGGPLVSRLETARGKKLSAGQKRQVQQSEREYARELEPLRRGYVRDVARATGLPEAKLRKVLARDQGDPATQQRTVAQLEKQLGRRLTAGDANRVSAARDQFRAAVQSQRETLADDVGKITGMPRSVVLELMH